MKLNRNQRKILRLVQLQAEFTIEEIAHRVKMQRQSVARNLNSLVSDGVLRKAVFVNLAPLGFTRYNLLFTTSARIPTDRKRLVRELAKDQNVIFVGEISGDWEFEVTFAARSAAELPLLMDRVADRIEDGFFEKSLAVVLEKHLFGTKILDPSVSVPPLSLKSLCEKVEIDEIDHKLLYLLANQGAISQREIARQLRIPASTVNYRINHLKEQGLILGQYYILFGNPLGLVRFKILIYTRGKSGPLREALYDFSKDHKNIDILMVCVGAYDYELSIQTNEYSEVVTLGEELRAKFRDEIVRIKILTIFDNHKFSDYPFKTYQALTTLLT
jgi:DNA-binding Lrp family transcriptional regulator